MRPRTTIVAMLVVGIALVVAALGLIAQQRSTLESHLDDVSDVRASGIAALIGAGTLPKLIPMASDDDTRLPPPRLRLTWLRVRSPVLDEKNTSAPNGGALPPPVVPAVK